jgi:hypothetical protein
MSLRTLQCPQTGHKTFEKSLSHITIGDVDTPEQITKFIRPSICTSDDLNMKYEPGVLQRVDLIDALSMFAYGNFISATFKKNIDLFRYSQCRIYQFQTIIKKSGKPFIFGLIITDGSHNLIDFCLETPQSHKRRTVLVRLIRAICTPESIMKKLNH